MSSSPSQASPRHESADTLKAKALKGDPLPVNDLHALEELIDVLEKERQALMSGGDFKNALKHLTAMEHTKQFISQAQKVEFQKTTKEEVAAQLIEVKARIAEYDKKMDQEEEALKKNLADSRQRLVDDLNKQAQENEELWNSDTQKRKYNKPSNKLRDLRLKVKNLMMSRRFKDAEVILAEADALQTQEQAENSRQLQLDYDASVRLLQTKIAEEQAVFDENARLQIANFEVRRHTNREPFEHQLKKVEQREELAGDVERLWNSKQKQILDEREHAKSPKSSRVQAKDMGESGPMVLNLSPISSKKSTIKTSKAADYL